MSRLGDMIKLERTRRNLTPKQVAKLSGVAEKYIIEVEAGKRIIADDQARRILKKIGLEHQTEADFSLDDIAAAADLAAAKAKPSEDSPQPTQKPKDSPVLSLPAQEGSGIFLDALADVLRQVPIHDATWQVIGHRMLPVLSGRIEGGAADKVLYFRAPDASCRGFRILAGDIALIVPANSPIDGALMLVEHKSRRMLRKIKILDSQRVLLQSYDQEYVADSVSVGDVSFVGRAVRIEITL